ncbi:phosphomannose isomerase type II C-terminal cupin domain [Patescibacteria group bacterium]|nr:phosphomannose isomerase type II C-terminal cupin domain [Patescibacteria group bacterium]MCG2695283.1 phosphomannose isomerase type II C-terminal cupin domain [Candidatus Parcubacteria bacterium]
MNFYTEKRPWGEFKEFTKNEKATVKIITVKAGEKISLQLHHNREEFWKVLSGNPTIQIGEEKTEAKTGDEFFVPKETKHRISANDSSAEILEIAFGEFDENDEVRFDDDYGRVENC